MSITSSLAKIKATIPEGVELDAVSKFHPVEALQEAYDAGQRTFGESRVQEIIEKIPQLPEDIQWHFIGHLQTNKVRRLVCSRRISLIESIDSENLLRIVDSEASRAGIVQRVLMQVHVAQEETKYGFAPEELLDFFARGEYKNYTSIAFCGIMGMATNTDDQERICADFSAIANTHQQIAQLCPELSDFKIVSMGMSDDYPLAIAAGSTLVRVGTAIFGARESTQS